MKREKLWHRWSARLRDEGLTYRQIAERVNKTAPAVHFALNPDAYEKIRTASQARYYGDRFCRELREAIDASPPPYEAMEQ